MFAPSRLPKSWGWVVEGWVDQPLEGVGVWMDLAPRTPVTPYGRVAVMTWGDGAAVEAAALPRRGFVEFLQGLGRLEWEVRHESVSDRLSARSRGYTGPDLEIYAPRADTWPLGMTVIEVERRTLCEVPSLQRWPARLGWPRETQLVWADPAAEFEPRAERAGCRLTLTFDTGEVVLRLVPEWATDERPNVGRWAVTPIDVGDVSDREVAALLEGLRWSLR